MWRRPAESKARDGRYAGRPVRACAGAGKTPSRKRATQDGAPSMLTLDAKTTKVVWLEERADWPAMATTLPTAWGGIESPAGLAAICPVASCRKRFSVGCANVTTPRGAPAAGRRTVPVRVGGLPALWSADRGRWRLWAHPPVWSVRVGCHAEPCGQREHRLIIQTGASTGRRRTRDGENCNHVLRPLSRPAAHKQKAQDREVLGSKLAARLGIEPRQTDSESVVLPLHHRAVLA